MARVPASVIAHRGASGHAAENTVAAFDLALRQGAGVLELDVRATLDGDVVVVHDPTLLRTTGDPRRVDELSLPALAALGHPARPVALDTILRRYGRSVRYLVDLKEPRPSWERRVLDAIERHGLGDRIAVQSFDLGALERLRRCARWLAISALYRRADSLDLKVAAIPSFASAVGLWHGAVDAAFVVAAHARRLAVHPWTVDDAPEAQRLLALGVDGLITNLPDVVVAARHRAVAALPAAA